MPRKPRAKHAYKSECHHEPDITTCNSQEWREWRQGNIESLCNFGLCSQDLCPFCGRITGGVGPMMCPHDIVRGWAAPYPEQQGKPHPAVKAKGRNYDRIRRAEREIDKYNRWAAGWSPAVFNL